MALGLAVPRPGSIQDNDDFFNGSRLENDPLYNVRYMGNRSQESVGRDTDNMVVSFSVFW